MEDDPGHPMILYLFILIEPVQTIQLPFKCSALAAYGDNIYLAPFVGKGILKVDPSGNFEVKQFTESENYRIYNFVVAPFALYLNNSRSIEKFYINQGIKETIYKGDEIASFIVTPEEESLVSEIKRQELLFLNSNYEIKLRIKNLRAMDIAISDRNIFVLTQKGIKVFDRYGNIIEKIEIPERFERVFADSFSIYLFSSRADYIYKWAGQWEKIEVGKRFSNFLITQNNVYILDAYGANLYIYNRIDF